MKCTALLSELVDQYFGTLEYEFDELSVVLVDAELQGGPAFLGGFVDVCPVGQQLLADRQVPSVDGTVVGRPTSRPQLVYYLATVLLLTLYFN